MRSFSIALILSITSLLQSGESNGVSADPSDLKALFGFNTWPGKGNPMKKGLNFQIGDYPSLAGFMITSNTYGVNSGICRRIVLKKEQQTLILTITVAEKSCAEAHEILALRLAQTSADYELAYKLFVDGDIGDVRFIDPDADADTYSGSVGFCRNNVTCNIREVPGGKKSVFNVAALARQIDAKIKALPDLTSAQFDALRPVISEFRPVDPIRTTQAGTDQTNLVISVHDPAGESVKEIVDDLGGKLDVLENTLPVRVQTTSRSGAALPLELVAVNDSLQFSTARTAIKVTSPNGVEDETPPVLVVPQPIQIECTGCDGTIVQFPPATATDDETTNPVITYSHAIGSRFPLGVTVVQVTATDEAGNVASGNFTVTVKDTTSPIITASSETKSLWPPDHKFATVTLTGTISDACHCSLFTSAAITATVTVVDADSGDGGKKKEPDFKNFAVVSVDTQGAFTATLELRKERAGTGTGRKYQIVLSASDKSGNAGTSSAVEVAVPHDEPKK